MIDKEPLLNDKEFLKSFKDGLELQSFFRELQVRAVSQTLEGEMDSHLGYEKHERSGKGNSHNGHFVGIREIWKFRFPEIAMVHSIPSSFSDART